MKTPIYLTIGKKKKYLGTREVIDNVIVWDKGPLKEDHIMALTGTPGYDVSMYDAVFRGQLGLLTFGTGQNRYEIDTVAFEQHRFERDFGVGPQWFVHIENWTLANHIPDVSPLRPFTPPQKLEFGQHIRCHRCKGSGKNRKGQCDLCKGYGFVPWVNA